MRKIAEALARKKGEPKLAKNIIGGMTPEQKKHAFTPVAGKRPDFSKPRTVIKAAMKPKIMEQTPVGMANSTKSTPYIPPAKKNTKVKL